MRSTGTFGTERRAGRQPIRRAGTAIVRPRSGEGRAHREGPRALPCVLSDPALSVRRASAPRGALARFLAGARHGPAARQAAAVQIRARAALQSPRWPSRHFQCLVLTSAEQNLTFWRFRGLEGSLYYEQTLSNP